MQIGVPAGTPAGETRTPATLATAPRGPAMAICVAAPARNAARQCPR
jgi:hypothetical protein